MTNFADMVTSAMLIILGNFLFLLPQKLRYASRNGSPPG